MNNTLTLKEAVDKHRQLWNWIADETEKRQRIVSKGENPMVQEDKPDNNCYCCQFVIEQYGAISHYRCKKCPLNWGQFSDGTFYRCSNFNALYDLWCDILRNDIIFDNESEKLKEAVRVAREIANLPLKPVYQIMYDSENTKKRED